MQSANKLARMTRSLFFAAAILLVSSIDARAETQPEITSDVVYGHKAGMALTFDVVKPKEPNGAGVLFMMSGGWVSMWAPPEQLMSPEAWVHFPFFRQLLDRGYTLFIVRHGSSPQFKVPEAVADVRRAVRFIRLNAEKYGVDAERLGVCGGSAGGHLSLMLGTTSDEGNQEAPDEVERAGSRVKAVVAYFAPVDLRSWVGSDAPSRPKTLELPALDFDVKLAESVSPLLHVTSDDAATLLVHGDKDELVTLDNSQQFLAALEKEKVDCDLLVLKGAGHSFPGEMGERASKALVDWFDKQLAAPANSNGEAAKKEAAAIP